MTNGLQSLSNTQRRIYRRIRRTTPWSIRLAQQLLDRGRARFVHMVPSLTLQSIMRRGYDAETLQRIYRNVPEGEIGPYGAIVDRILLNSPLHQGLRERLQATIGEMTAAAVVALHGGTAEFRVLVAPFGCGAELEGLAARLRQRNPDLLPRVRCWGVDGTMNSSSRARMVRRLAEQGLSVRIAPEDLRRNREAPSIAAEVGPFHLISLVGAGQSVVPIELGRLVEQMSRCLAPGGTMLIDRWSPAESDRYAQGLGLSAQYLSAADLAAVLTTSGLVIEREHPTGEGGCTVTVCRKPLPS